jgi:hypothetical protein
MALGAHSEEQVYPGPADVTLCHRTATRARNALFWRADHASISSNAV